MNMPDLTALTSFHDAALVVAGAVLFALQLLLWLALRRQRVRERRRLDDVQRLEKDVAALCSAANGVGERLVRIEDLVRRLTERHDQLELRAGADRHYGQAIRLVQGGAGVDELIASCGLTRGEADLIVMLHGVARAS
ncbi:MAG: DUF2802 domain-containing protein [Gammaproteobacteria bacterium]